MPVSEYPLKRLPICFGARLMPTVFPRSESSLLSMRGLPLAMISWTSRRYGADSAHTPFVLLRGDGAVLPPLEAAARSAPLPLDGRDGRNSAANFSACSS